MVQESMEKVRGKFNEIKAKIDRISHWVLVALLATVCFGAGYACGPRNAGRTDVYDHGTELTQLENNLTELKTINEALRTACSGQQIKAAELQVKLTKAEELSRTLQSHLADLQAKSTRQEALLTQANQSLMQYAAEEKRTRLRIKSQRNTWEIVAAGLLVAWAAK